MVRWLAVVIVLLVAVAGCGAGGLWGESVDEQYETLAKRPDIEQITAWYEEIQERIRERIAVEFGLAPWSALDSETGAGCGEFPDVDAAETRQSPIWQAEGHLPDVDWDRAVAVVAKVAREYGFGKPQVLADRPGNHEVFAQDQFGGRFQFGTVVNTTMLVLTGCHLTPEAHPGEPVEPLSAGAPAPGAAAPVG